MGRRILAIRLRELEQDGFIARVERRRGYVLWQLTVKRQDVLPVLLTLIHFASKWRPPGSVSEGANFPLARDFEIIVHPVVRARDPGLGSSPVAPVGLFRVTPLGPEGESSTRGRAGRGHGGRTGSALVVGQSRYRCPTRANHVSTARAQGITRSKSSRGCSGAATI